MKQLYTLFHLNLMYSSLEEDQRKDVITKCYWPLLRTCDELDWPLSIELTGLTLSYIKDLDPEWVNYFKQLLSEKKCELIGSGYSQIIGPLVPAKVNDWNQKLGLDTYQTILNIRPKIALINEMAYSSGLIQHYLNHNYNAIIMEWNNPYSIHKEWDRNLQFHPQIVQDQHGNKCPIIWANSIAFQKFQRYAHQEITLKEYADYIESIPSNDGYFPFYSNDAEVFNFRMHRFNTEAQCNTNEWERIKEAIISFKENHTFILPSEILKGLNHPKGGKPLALESPQQPIVVKKQEKYNINRWALSGKNDLELNTTCFNLYTHAITTKTTDPSYWKSLCFFWSSDFRTHITQNRWTQLQKEITSFKKKHKVTSPTLPKKPSLVSTPHFKHFSVHTKNNTLEIENNHLHLTLNTKKGLTIHACTFKDISLKPLIGTLPHGYYDDISLGADFYSGHMTIEQPGHHKITDLCPSHPNINEYNTILTITDSFKFNDIQQTVQLSISKNQISISKTIQLPSRILEIIHPFNFTILPQEWDISSMVFQTHNGGALETFPLSTQHPINHSETLSSLISAKHGLGATKGVIMITDNNRSLQFQHNTSHSALIPTLYFQKPKNDPIFCRLQYSAQELDETFKINSTPPLTLSTQVILCCKKNQINE